VKIIKKLFFVVINIILLSSTVFAVSENNINTKTENALVADFFIIPSSHVPQTITFIDKSTGSPTSWFWNFGDNSNSTFQNPIHKYSVPEKYTVTLTVTKLMYTSTVTKIINFTGCKKDKSHFQKTN
jgi:PKD repeat protein